MPTKLLLNDTNWSVPDGDGMDNFPDSMLDFAGPAKDWQPVNHVIVRAGNLPDAGRFLEPHLQGLGQSAQSELLERLR